MMAHTHSPQLVAALSYAKRMWPVAPAHNITARGTCSCGNTSCSAGKHPRTRNGLDDATLDEAQITEWWTRWPDANILVRTGMVGDRCLVVLDIDPKHDGDESLRMLEARHGVLPLTPRTITGSQGQHFWFWSSKPLRNSSSKIAMGVDTRGVGGYVIVPPSNHLSGRSYQWDSGADPDEVPLAEAPPWLAELVAKRSAPEPSGPLASAFIEGGRNNALASLAGTMRGRGFEGASIEAALLIENEKKCRPPLDPREVQTIAQSYAKYPPSAAAAAVAEDPWNLMTTEQIFAELPPYPWLVQGLHIAPGRITLLNGYADVGKTVIAMTLALAVASGCPVWDVYKPARAGKVLHLNGEIGSYLARERYQRLARGMAIDEVALIEQGNLTLANYPTIRLDDRDFEPKLALACAGYELVIIDSLRAFSGALDENAKEIGVALFMLARVSQATGATIMVLHHNRKPTRDDVGGAKMAISGSSSILGGAECAFVMHSTEKGGPVLVQHERSPIGRPLSDFGLLIEDIALNGEPRWGLRVQHIEGEQLEAMAERVRERRERLESDKASKVVVEALERNAGVFRGSKNAFRELCGIGKGPFLKCLSELTSNGIVHQLGDYHKPEWHLRGQ